MARFVSPFSVFFFFFFERCDIKAMFFDRFWLAVCHMLRWHWHYKIPLPRMPNPERKRFTLDSENAEILDTSEPKSPPQVAVAHLTAQIDETDLASIDVRYCIVHQQLALLNGCITTIQRQQYQKKILDLYPGHQGALKKMQGVFLFDDKDEPLYVPATQDPPLLVESDLREAEDLVMRLNSLGMGAKSLQLDIAAFKAANPKAKLPDFVRWYVTMERAYVRACVRAYFYISLFQKNARPSQVLSSRRG